MSSGTGKPLGEMFGAALDLLQDSGFAPLRNDGSGRRYYVMSRLFSGVVESILAGRATRVSEPEARPATLPAVDLSRTSP